MMLQIRGIPISFKYQDVKKLLKNECNVTDFILDSLLPESDDTKKVRIGLSSDMDGSQIIKCLDGFRMGGNLLTVRPVGKGVIVKREPWWSHELAKLRQEVRQAFNTAKASKDFQPYSRLLTQYNSAVRRAKRKFQRETEENSDHITNIPEESLEASQQGNFGRDGFQGRPDSKQPHHSFGNRPMDDGPKRPWNAASEWIPNRIEPPQQENKFFPHNQGNFPPQQGPSRQQFGQHDTFGGRPQPGPGPFPPKPGMMDNARQRLDLASTSSRNMDMDPHGRPGPGPMGPNRFANQYDRQEKQAPVTIMKDNFQGSQQGPFRNQGPVSPWQGQQNAPTFTKPGPSFDKPFDNRNEYNRDPDQRGLIKPIMDQRKMDYEKPRFSPPRRFSPSRGPTFERQSSPGRRMDGRMSPGRRMDGRPMESGRPMSPGRRIDSGRMSPGRMQPRQMSPGRRMPPGRVSPGRRMEPGRQMSPGRKPMEIGRQSPGRKIEFGRQMSPGRRIEPGRISPTQRMGPGRQMSPGRRFEPGRMSPGRRMEAGRQSPGRRFEAGRVSPGRRMEPGRQVSPGRRIEPGRMSPGRRFEPGRVSPGRRMEPGRQMSPSRRMEPGRQSPVRKIEPVRPGRQSPGRRMEPGRTSPGRRMEPGRTSPGRRMEPGRFSPGRKMEAARQVSPGRHMDPARQMSPGRRIPSGRQSPGRRMEPGRRPSPGRRVSPIDGSPGHDRRMSPGRRGSPRKRVSPGFHGSRGRSAERRGSPGRMDRRRDSPSMRYGDNRHMDKHGDKIDPMKQVRPAYEPTQAPNPMYPGGYRPNNHENVPFSTGPRQDRPWQDKGFPQKMDDDRRDMARPKFEPPIETDKRSTGARESRSPRRDRSPIRDRFRRHSPSPRSPRRSWALEKRRSPECDVPPPPVWPGQEDYSRRDFPDRMDKDRVPVWEFPISEEKKGFDDSRFEKEPIHEREPKWKPVPQSGTGESRFRDPGRDFYNRRHDFCRDDDRRDDKRDFREFPRQDKDGFPPRRDDFHREELKTEYLKQKLDKEIEDVYKRAVDFTRKAEVYRKDDRRRDVFEEDRRRDDRDGKYRRENGPRGEFSEGCRSREEMRRDVEKPIKLYLSAEVKAKREKAIDEISAKIINKYGSHITGEIRNRVLDELRLAISRTFLDMFGQADISFIEMIVKFHSKYGQDEEKFFDEVMSSFPTHLRSRKRGAQGGSDISPKTSRYSPQKEFDKDLIPVQSDRAPEWEMNFTANMPNMMQMAQASQVPLIYHAPMMVPMPTMVPSVQNVMPMQSMQPMQPMQEEVHNLYLCKDDFQPFNDMEAEYLKQFLISQIFKITQMCQGWAPDVTLKGLQRQHRYEVFTSDDRSRDWLLHLDFSEFQLFNVLVYTKEELWYERAAIWLPGHSRVRNIQPLMKLKLQNRNLEDVNIERKDVFKRPPEKRKHIETKPLRKPVPPKNDKIVQREDKNIPERLNKNEKEARKNLDGQEKVEKTELNNAKPLEARGIKRPRVAQKCDAQVPTAQVETQKTGNVQKVEISKPKVSQEVAKIQPAKTPTVAKKDDKVNQNEDKPEKEVDASDGHYELGPLMTRLLDSELQETMNQINKVLDDSPTTKQGQVVVSKFKSEVVHSIKNVFGLNITKRLLNVYNPLFVKIRFSCRPEHGTLTDFLKKYKISGFKRIEKEKNMFAAEIEDITAFDSICNAKTITCGSAKVIVTPCYKFTKCPDKLKTKYNKDGVSDAKESSPEPKPTEPKPVEVKAVKKENIVNVPASPQKPVKEAVVKKEKPHLAQKVPTELKRNIKKEEKKITPTKSDKNVNRAKKLMEIIPEISEYDDYNDEFGDEVIGEDIPDSDEEMDDEDILALISSGVVLDECTGSEDEL